MGALFDMVKTFLESDDWQFKQEDDRLLMNFGGKNGEWPCMAYVRESAGQVLFYSLAPVDVELKHYADVLEFIARANFGMFVGNFELDVDSGTLQFRTSIDIEDDEDKLTPHMLKSLLYQNVLTMDKYLPGLQAVLAGRSSAAEAIADAEG